MSRAGEFPAEEFADIPDWNAVTWAQILVRDAKKLARYQRGDFLASRSKSDLAAMKSVLMQEAVLSDLQDDVATEIARRNEDD